MKEQEPTVVWTSTRMAQRLGVNRSTLVRLEQRGILPLAPKVRVIGRVYDAALQRATITAFDKYMAAQAAKDADAFERPDAPKKVLVA